MLTNEAKLTIVKEEVNEGRYTGTIDIPSMHPTYRHSKHNNDTTDELLFRVKVNTIFYIERYRKQVKLTLNSLYGVCRIYAGQD